MIKQIKRENIPECVSVIRESFMTVADELKLSAETSLGFTGFSISEERLYWQYDNEKRPMFAYFINEKIVGYYSLLILDNNECELNNLAVLPYHRHRKIGEELLKDSFSRARELNIRKMKISIVEENVKLRKWYEKHNFIHTETKKLDQFAFICGYMEIDL